MKALTKILAGGAFVAALVSAAPAAAQYYPGYGYGSPYGGNVVGQVLNQVLGGGYGNYGGYGGYGVNSQAAINQCAAAVQQRIARDYGYGRYGYGGYGGYGQYGYNGYGGGGRVLGITRIEPRSNGQLRVRGVATSGVNAGYGGADLTFSCRVDYRGYIADIDLKRINAYGSNYNQYDQYNPYSAYGYRRY